MLKVERQGAVDVIRPQGSVRDENLEELRAICQRLVDRGWPAIVLDLSQAALLSGEALQWLRDLDQQCADCGGSVCVAAPGEICAETLRITGVGQHLQLFPDVGLAVARFAS